VVGFIFLLISTFHAGLIYFSRYSFKDQDPTALAHLNLTEMVLRPFSWISVVLLLIAPLLTMRVYA
jgi:hypothetical protein